MNLLKDFGINPLLLVAQIVNFAIIIFVLQKFAYKPILSMLKKRKDAIEKGLKQAEESRLLLEQAEQKQEQIIRRASEQAAKMIKAAKTHSQEISLDIEKRAKEQSEKILADAKEQIALETKMAEKKLVQKINEISLSLLEKSLQGIFSKTEEEEIINKALKNIKQTN